MLWLYCQACNVSGASGAALVEPTKRENNNEQSAATIYLDTLNITSRDVRKTLNNHVIAGLIRPFHQSTLIRVYRENLTAAWRGRYRATAGSEKEGVPQAANATETICFIAF